MIFAAFMPGGLTAQSTNVKICDNGGFEDDFLNYEGYYGNYYNVNFPCTQLDTFGQPTTWHNISMPSYHRFKIVTGGFDSLIGVNKVKFGNKSLLLNFKYGYKTDSVCGTNGEMNRIVKRFKVTEENRDFTVWYAAALENADHRFKYPFFSIRCDRAYEFDLCLEAPTPIYCPIEYQDTICNPIEPVNRIKWSCHRIVIPQNMVDSIATLEIIASDCGLGCHFGYAYIDGICEQCNVGDEDLVKLYNHPIQNGVGIHYGSCNGDTVLICGKYKFPEICNNFNIDSITVPGFQIVDLVVNEQDSTFCFKLPKGNFPDTNCRELFVVIYVKSLLSYIPPKQSNSILICPNNFLKYEIAETVIDCNKNNTDNLLSDDYYYVTLNLKNIDGASWVLHRLLDDPYPNESGYYQLKTGSGNDSVILGPFLIQEGGWTLLAKIKECSYTIHINAPNFCSGCNTFRRTIISNIACNSQNSTNPYDDTWTFDIHVQWLGQNSAQGKSYKINNGGTDFDFNKTYTIDGGLISGLCKNFFLIGSECNEGNNIIICPPKTCSITNICRLEAYVYNIYCNQSGTDYYFDLETKGGQSLCYISTDTDGQPINNNQNNQQGNVPNGSFGPFNDDIYLQLYNCNNSSCFKSIYIPKLGCYNQFFHGGSEARNGINVLQELIVIPNPVNSNMIHLKSIFSETSFELYNFSNKLLFKDSFTGPDFNFNLELPASLYIIRYKNFYDKYNFIKLLNSS